MDKKPLEVKSYNVEDERRFKDLTARVVSLEYWRGAAQMVKRIKALEQWMDAFKDRPDGCTEADLRFLERSNNDVWPRLAALEEWQGHAQADIRATERRADQDGDRLAALEARCHELEHGRATGVQEQIADLQQRVGVLEETGAQPLREHIRRVRAAAVDPPEVRYAPVGDHAGLWRCPAVNCYHHYGAAWCRHGRDHERRHDCAEFCCCNTCQPVPASPEPAIPDVPTPVGTEAFRRELTGHMQTLAQAYSWDADSLPMWGRDYLERMAGVACTLRDAYELARTGEHEAAQEKLEEIEW